MNNDQKAQPASDAPLLTDRLGIDTFGLPVGCAIFAHWMFDELALEYGVMGTSTDSKLD